MAQQGSSASLGGFLDFTSQQPSHIKIQEVQVLSNFFYLPFSPWIWKKRNLCVGRETVTVPSSSTGLLMKPTAGWRSCTAHNTIPTRLTAMSPRYTTDRGTPSPGVLPHNLLYTALEDPKLLSLSCLFFLLFPQNHACAFIMEINYRNVAAEGNCCLQIPWIAEHFLEYTIWRRTLSN